MAEERVESIDYYVLKIGKDEDDSYESRSDDPDHDHLPGTDYYIQEAGLVYPRYREHLLVKLTTDRGTHGWGEVQAPLAPEVAATVIETLVGPMVLGKDPRNVTALWDRMYDSMNIRGHYQGFMIDAMAGLDIALWDLKGKLLGESVSTLLGGRKRDRLDAYMNGGDASDLDAGFVGIQDSVYGMDDLPLPEALQSVSDPSRVFIEHHWRFDSAHEALQVGRELEEFGVGFVECPLEPEDIDGSARIADALDIPVVVGESLRTTHDFKIRLDRDAFDMANPDINRTGLTEGRRIATLLDSHGRSIAPHLSMSMGPGVAATWHLSASVSNFAFQEHNGRVIPGATRFTKEGLEVDSGKLVVPDGPGLGVDVDEDAIESEVTRSGRVEDR